MSLSLRGRMLLLVTAAITMAAAPLILYSRGELLDSAMQKERASFVNTVTLVEDSLSTRYLQFLTSEVQSVLDAKKEMRRAGMVARGMLMKAHTAADYADVADLQRLLAKEGLHLALYGVGGQPLVADGYVDLLLAEGRKDYKGQDVRARLGEGRSASDAGFVVSRVPRGDFGDMDPVLGCFVPVKGVGTLVLALPLTAAEEERLQLEKGMVSGIQDKLDALEMGQDTSISVIASDGRALASRGREFSLDAIPYEALAKVREEGRMEGETSGPDGSLLFYLDYFKPMDWYLVAAVPLSVITAPAEGLVRDLSLFAGGLLLVSLLTMFLLVARAIAPLGLLTEKAKALAAEDLSPDRTTALADELAEGLPVDRQDEIGQLAGAFAHMVKALDENIRHLVDTLAARQRMQGELAAARDIQMGILPPADGAPVAEGYHAAAFLEPAKEVGGDLYDFFVAPDGRQVVVIGDVSDKGVSAALFMSMTVTLVRYAIAEGLSCAEAMERINERLAQNNPSCMFVTLFIGLFDPKDGSLEYASGAHCPPFVVSRDRGTPVRALSDVSGPLVGAMEGMGYAACHARLAPGEYCLLYTDGVSEAMDESLALFGEERIANVLDGLRDESPEGVIRGVMEAVERHRGMAPRSDDITMLCFQRS